MDWRQITQDVSELEGLSDEARVQKLLTMSESGAAKDAFITGYFERRRRGQSFMQTSELSAPSPADQRLAAGSQIGVWEIKELIASGGMGQVYKASRADGRYNQIVALKVMGTGAGNWRRRFELERQRLARMDHPGVSRIIDGGESDDGLPFMAMEFVDGLAIDAYAAEKRPTRRALLSSIEELCGAAAHAHGKLILHRDIKPSNILVDAEGRVRLIDFGVASLLEDDELGGAGPLTIAYAAPEQLRSEAPSVATDIFAVGMVMHRLLTGDVAERRPDGAVEINAAALDDADLVAVIKKATAAEPSNRYASMDTLAEDIRAIRDLRPVAASKGGRFYRIGKFIQRYPAASGLAAAFLMTLTGGLGASLMMADRANDARMRAEYFLDRAERSAAIEGTYVDILDRVFGSEEDAERIKKVMLERAAEAFEHRDVDPETAAEISLVVGEHFIYGYDYPTAQTVLEPWVKNGFGSPELLRDGKLNLAVVYERTGKRELAQNILEELGAAYEHPLDRLSDERLEYLAEWAMATGEQSDMRVARDLFEESVSNDNGDDPDSLITRLYFLQMFSKQLGDFETGYQTALRSVAVYDQYPLVDLHTWGAVHNHLAAYELYYKKNYQKAGEIIDAIIAWNEENGSPDDTTFRMKAMLAMLQGEYDQAESLLLTAQKLEKEYLALDRYSRAMLIELYVMKGETERAKTELTELLQEVDPDNTQTDLHPRMTFAAAFVSAAIEGPEAASNLLNAHGFTREKARTQPAWIFRLERLEQMGVVVSDA